MENPQGNRTYLKDSFSAEVPSWPSNRWEVKERLALCLSGSPNAKYNSSGPFISSSRPHLQSSERAEDIKVSIDRISFYSSWGWGAQSPRDLPSWFSRSWDLSGVIFSSVGLHLKHLILKAICMSLAQWSVQWAAVDSLGMRENIKTSVYCFKINLQKIHFISSEHIWISHTTCAYFINKNIYICSTYRNCNERKFINCSRWFLRVNIYIKWGKEMRNKR